MIPLGIHLRPYNPMHIKFVEKNLVVSVKSRLLRPSRDGFGLLT